MVGPSHAGIDVMRARWNRSPRSRLSIVDAFVDAVDGRALRCCHGERREAVHGGREAVEVPRVGRGHHEVRRRDASGYDAATAARDRRELRVVGRRLGRRVAALDDVDAPPRGRG